MKELNAKIVAAGTGSTMTALTSKYLFYCVTLC